MAEKKTHPRLVFSGPGVLQAEAVEILRTAEGQRQLKALKALKRHTSRQARKREPAPA